MRPAALLLAALAAAVPAVPSRAAEERLAPAVERLQRAAAGVRTIVADFEQELHSEIFEAPVVSKGRLIVAKPDRVRWETTAPARGGFTLAGAVGRRWGGRTKEPAPFDVSREPAIRALADQLLAWTGGDFERLARDYRIRVTREAPIVLRLEPRRAADLDRIVLSFSADGTVAETVELYERDGDLTRIRFRNAVVNGALPGDAF